MAEFSGFSKNSLKFFSDLEKNNTKEWFTKHRDIYEIENPYPRKGICSANGTEA